MKKYWKLLLFVVVIVFTFTHLYIQAANASKDYPKYVLKTIEGDTSAVESLVINGSYTNMYNHETLQIDQEGTEYWRDKPFFKQVDGQYRSIEWQTLQSKYKQFMRGKSTWQGNLANEEEYLAFADIPYSYYVPEVQTFEISVLNKKTGETLSFEYPVPNVQNYLYMNVLHVHLVENQLFVLTENGGEDDRQEIHLYTFDLEKRLLTHDEQIIILPRNENEMVFEQTAFVKNTGKGASTVAIAHQNFEQSFEDGAHDIIEQTIYIYDFSNESMKTVNVNEYGDDVGTLIAFKGENLYFAQQPENGQRSIAKLDLKKEEFQLDFINFTTIQGEQNTDMLIQQEEFKVHDGKLFSMPLYKETDEPAYLTVADLESGKQIYQGEVVPIDEQDLKKGSRLQINDYGWK